MLTKKYQPKYPSEIFGQEQAIKELKMAIMAKRPVLLYGPSGCGKTASIYALANELNYEIVEFNASDYRGVEQIETTVSSAYKQQSLFHKGKIVLVDEVDAISGTKDRGGLVALSDLLENKSNSLVLIANDIWKEQLVKIRKKCALVEFSKLGYATITALLKEICAKEKIEYDEKTLRELAVLTGGDARAAINDLEAIRIGNKLQHVDTGQREREESIINSLNLILRTRNASVALTALKNVDIDYEECLQWLDENLPFIYRHKDDLLNAYRILAKIDILTRRIKKQQNYHLMVYQEVLLTAGVALAKKERCNIVFNYKKPSRIFKYFITKAKRARLNETLQEIATACHMSLRKARQELPFVSKVLEKTY